MFGYGPGVLLGVSRESFALVSSVLGTSRSKSISNYTDIFA